VYPVSTVFKNAIKAKERRVYGKVQIDYTSPFLDQSISITASENANVSYPEQTADGAKEPFSLIASLDGSWVLDGTYSLAPTKEEAEKKQMGWWGSQISDAGGAFAAPYPKLTTTFLPRAITNLQVIGDSKREEWPVDFSIKIYDGTDTLLHTETVTENTEIEWKKTLDTAVTQAEKITLEITKWSHAGRQVKILEFLTSIQEIYEGDDILMIHLLEEREVSQGSLPIGNISANEIDIRLDNSTRKFDAGNIASPLYQMLKANRRIKAWLGVEKSDEEADTLFLQGSQFPAKVLSEDKEDKIEYVPLGTFWSGDWSVPENGVYAHVVGRDRLEMLRNSDYSTSYVQQGKSLYSIAQTILTDAGLEEGEYWIDASLQSYVIPYAYFTPQSHREALRKIAEACLGQVYCDRNGVIRIEGSSYLTTESKEEYCFVQGIPFPAKGEQIDAYGIGADDYYDKNNPVKWSEIANYIEVETQPLSPDTIQEVYRSSSPESIEAGELKSTTIFYNESPCINFVATLENAVAGAAIISTKYYAWGAYITIYSPNKGTYELKVNGKPLRVMNKEKAIAMDNGSITDNGKIVYSFPANHLVQTKAQAQTIANALLASFKDPRRDIEISWRGNPALELGDVIIAPDFQRAGIDKRGYYYVTRQEIEYTGALQAKLNGRKA
jgi:hypothetical protein